jgi:hypothetical protein
MEFKEEEIKCLLNWTSISEEIVLSIKNKCKNILGVNEDFKMTPVINNHEYIVVYTNTGYYIIISKVVNKVVKIVHIQSEKMFDDLGNYTSFGEQYIKDNDIVDQLEKIDFPYVYEDFSLVYKENDIFLNGTKRLVSMDRYYAKEFNKEFFKFHRVKCKDKGNWKAFFLLEPVYGLNIYSIYINIETGELKECPYIQGDDTSYIIIGTRFVGDIVQYFAINDYIEFEKIIYEDQDNNKNYDYKKSFPSEGKTQEWISTHFKHFDTIVLR